MISPNLTPYATALMSSLKEGGATSVLIEFDGSGDSGSITEITIEGGNPNPTAEWLTSSSSYSIEEKEWTTTYEVKTLEIKKALELWCYDALEKTNIDWYNNDGGFGEMIIDLTQNIVQLVVTKRYTEMSTHYFNDTDEEES